MRTSSQVLHVMLIDKKDLSPFLFSFHLNYLLLPNYYILNSFYQSPSFFFFLPFLLFLSLDLPPFTLSSLSSLHTCSLAVSESNCVKLGTGGVALAIINALTLQSHNETVVKLGCLAIFEVGIILLNCVLFCDRMSCDAMLRYLM